MSRTSFFREGLIALVGLTALGLASCDLVLPGPVRMAVFSDPHVYEPALGTEGPEFQRYIAGDRKLIAESSGILDALVRDFRRETDIDVVLVPGDLTKDGERASHLRVARQLRRLEESGKRVYVIPGNHDILNPHAARYSSTYPYTEPVPSVTAEEFAAIYKDFGFGEAMSRDPNSLSYAVLAGPKLVLIAMDPCRYDESVDHPVTGGLFPPETFDWIASSIRRARENGFTVFGMMHHGAAEHFPGQKALFADYVVDDWARVSREFADMGMTVVFTGHFHAQDIVKVETETGGFLFDIETGSTVTYPCPYRLVRLGVDGTLEVETRRIENVKWPTGGTTFQEYAYDFLSNGFTTTYVVDGVIRGMVPDMLMSLGVPPEALPVIEPYIPLIASAFVAHYQGDETLEPATYGDIMAFIGLLDLLDGTSDQLVPLGYALLSLFTDPPPGDNDVRIDLATGEILP
jgi:predicted phosphodiesterase